MVGSDYVLNCILIDYVHEIRKQFLRKITKKKISIEFKTLFFDSEEELMAYSLKNGIVIEKKNSKAKTSLICWVKG